MPALNTKLAFLVVVGVDAVCEEFDGEMEANCCVCGVRTADGVERVLLDDAATGVELVLFEDTVDVDGVLGMDVVSMMPWNCAR